jgi:hypothetical protein
MLASPRTPISPLCVQGHEGTKASRVVFCGELNKLFTVGFSKMSERQYAVWDPKDLSNALKVEMIDTGSGVLFPFYDNDTQIVYVGGKGDGNVRYFELEDAAPYAHYINEFKSATPQRGLGWLPKRGVSVGDCEVARTYKLTPKGSVEIVSFIVPRKVCSCFQSTRLISVFFLFCFVSWRVPALALSLFFFFTQVSPLGSRHSSKRTSSRPPRWTGPA